MTAFGGSRAGREASREMALVARRAKRLKVLAYVVVSISIVSALLCGAALAALATHGQGGDSTELVVSGIAGLAFVMFGSIAGYLFAFSARIDRRARGIAEPPGLGIVEGLRHSWHSSKT